MKKIGLKNPKGKLRWHLVFPFIPDFIDIVKVMEHGADKYAEDNWMENVTERPMYYRDATLRHLTSYIIGEKKDNDSGLPTLAHVICSLLIMMWRDRSKNEKTTRRTCSM